MGMKFTFCFSLLSAGLLTAGYAEEIEEKVPTPIVAIYDLEGRLSEDGQPSQGMFGPDFSQGMPMTMLDLAMSLAAAAEDDALQGVVVDIDQAAMSLAQLNELERGLAKVKAAGKDVWVYTDVYTPYSAMVGSQATQFAMMPEGMVSFRGLYTETMYFKGMLDKVGVQAEVVHIGDYKSFGETFYRTGPTEAAEEQQDQLLDDAMSLIKGHVAKGRGVGVEVVQAAIDDDLLQPQELLGLKLLDSLEHRTDFVERIEEHYGDEVSYEWGYAMKDRSGPKIEGFMDLMKVMFSSGGQIAGGRPYIAVVPLVGGISTASIAPLREEIRRMTRDPKAQALVLRVDSPGGSAMASEVLWEVLEEWKATDRPFAVSMGGVAASGGYYVASGADHIFAEEGTITGSIGVVGMKFVMGDAFDKLGISIHTEKRGEHADLYSSVRPFNPDQRNAVRRSMEDVYGTFLDHVREGRKGKLVSDVRQIAGGRVYLGQRARELGLVDTIGGVGDALLWVTEAADASDAEVVILPEPQNPFDALFGNTDGDRGDDELIRMGDTTPQKRELSGIFKDLLLKSQALSLLTDAQKQQLSRSFEMMDAIKDDSIQLLSVPVPSF